MGLFLNPKVLGSCIIGFALVAGAYVISNFGESNFEPQQTASTREAVKPVERIAIPVEDADNNGIEDWRDALVTTEVTADDITVEATEFTMPETVTGKMSLNFFEGIISSRIYAPFSPDDSEVIEQTVQNLQEEARQKLYSRSDLDIMTEWDDEDIVNYANTLAAIVITNSNPDLDPDILIISDIIRNQNYDRIEELQAVADVFWAYRDDSLLLPVPEPFVKTHLDLINTYQAVGESLEAVTLIEEDPMLSLIHLRRYQDDALGLKMALENVYEALVEYAPLFTEEDIANMFTFFSSDYQDSI